MNLCRDCRHIGQYWPGREVLCLRTENGEKPIEPVWGLPIFPTCESERSNADRCGKDGRYYEPRETPPPARAETEET